MDNSNPPAQNPQPTPEIVHGPSKTKLLLIGLGVLFVLGLGGAYVLGAKNNQPEQGQVAVSPTASQPIPTYNPTADWKTYRNEAMDIEFKYYNPEQDFHVIDEKDDVITFGHTTDGIPYVYLTVTKGKLKNVSSNKPCSDQEVSKIFPCLNGASTYETKANIEQINVNGWVANSIYFTEGIHGEHRVVQFQKPIILELKMRISGGGLDERFNQILSTFKFTDQAQVGDTANWKTYRDSTYQFTFQHPNDWTTQVKDYPKNNERLINIIKNDNPTLVSLSFSIKPDWSNTGDAIELPKNYTVGGIQAVKVDPPKKDEKTLERYQTNVYFEANAKTYVFMCTHNWDQDYRSTCENILSTVKFTE